MHLSQYGSVRLVVATSGMGALNYIVGNDLHRRGKVLIHGKRSRWDIETCFHDTKQLVGLGACQCRVAQAMERHVALVLLTFVVLQLVRLDLSETVCEAKRRLRLTVIQGDQRTPDRSIGSLDKGEIMVAA